MPYGLKQHLTEGEQLLALINDDLNEELITSVADWSTRLYQLVEEGAEENTGEDLQSAKDINDRIIEKITEVRQKLAKEITSAQKGSAAIKAYHGK